MMTCFGIFANPVRMRPACFLVIGLFFAAGACQKKKTPEAAIQTVQVGTVDEIEPNTPQRYSATILPNLQADLAFKSPGIIDRIHQVRGADGRIRDVEPGDPVTQGTELALVRPIDYQQRVDQGEAGVRQAQAQLAEAKAAYVNAERDYARARNLYSTASLIKPDFDQAQARYESTRAQVQAAQAGI
jgi:multidrug efflux pump subunit AcrA (membrane-fusion protein)